MTCSSKIRCESHLPEFFMVSPLSAAANKPVQISGGWVTQTVYKDVGPSPSSGTLLSSNTRLLALAPQSVLAQQSVTYLFLPPRPEVRVSACSSSSYGRCASPWFGPKSGGERRSLWVFAEVIVMLWWILLRFTQSRSGYLNPPAAPSGTCFRFTVRGAQRSSRFHSRTRTEL